MLYCMFCWYLDAGGVRVGVVATDWGPSNELMVELELFMPFTEDSVLFWEIVGGGGYVGEPACTTEAIGWCNGQEGGGRW